MTLAAAQHLASCARKQAASPRLADQLRAIETKRALRDAGWRALAMTIRIGD